ncbi:E3 ubiquitin-protein ligase Topors-like [Anopheles bellator]|uniref:E3 ubiquitin-protein ligase Topors-like n=1 Tax=Anopheles bellator TaxID=139047 RepID=UPI0026485C2C|nr:E3 ubiquitin-protein ligase Topors-like [Anopheles bellator]
MEEAAAVDCPPTPEILPLTSTPPPPSQFVVYSSSSEEADESADGRSSPPPKCAICLGKCRQKAYANSCRHQFCFRCLLEWSKVKPECPLCKQRFNSIVHYKSINCYEEHIVQTSNPLEQSLPREADFYRRLNFYVSDLPRITYHATLHMPTSQSELMQQLFMHQSSDVRRFIREFGDQVVPTRQNSIAWRQFIYRQRLYARPLPDVNGRFRVSSAHFYLMHPAQLHRILPWVEREVYAMETIAPTMSPPMAMRMGYLMNSFDIDSPDFLRALAPFVCSSFREHFRHELFNFARSPYDMIGYDQCVQYEPRFNHRNPVILSSSDEELDSEEVLDGVVNMSEPVASTSSSSSSMFTSNSAGTAQGSTSGTSGRGRTGRTQFRFEARSTNETVIMTGTLRESRAELAASLAEPSTPVIELNDNSDSPGSVSVPAGAATTSTRSTLRDGDNISLSSSDSDDCQFVLAQKPPHLRTPDHVVDLESDYDSDVVFVAVECANNQPATTNGDASEKHSLPLPKSDLSCEYNNGASTSSGYHGGAGSSGSGTSTRDKHYTRSRVNRYTGGMGVKSIYEASDSDEDEDEDNEDGELFSASPRSPASGSSFSSSNPCSCPNVCTVSSHDKVVYNLRTSVTKVTRGRKRKRNSRKTKQTGAKKNWRTRQRSTSSSSSSSSSSSDDSCGSNSRKNGSTGGSNSSDSTRSSSATSSSSSTSITSITSASTSSASSESHSGEPSIVVMASGERRTRLSTNWTAPKNKKTGKKESKAEASHVKPKTTRGNPKKKGAQSKSARPQTAPKKGNAAKSKTESGRSKREKPSVKRPKEQDAAPAAPMETESSQGKGAKKIGQYFVQIRPSSSPTTEIATDDENTTAGGGGSGRKRKLSRVIIKRYHQENQPAEMQPPGSQKKETETSAAPDECSSVKRTKSEVPVASCAPNGSNDEPTPGCSRNTVIAKTEVVDAPTASGSDSDSDATAVGNWQDTTSGTAASVIVSTSQLAQPTGADSAAELQLTLMEHEQLLEDANSVALDTLFSPTLHWAADDPPPLEDHLSISVSDTLSPQTFSTITFSPSSTSVSPLSAMLAIPSSSVPEIIEGIGSLASASQLPSSVVGAATIDGAIDELMSIIPADTYNNTASLTEDGPVSGVGLEATESSSGALSSCELLPPGREPTNPPGVRSVVAGSEVEL